MDIILTILLYALIASCVIRHISRTISIISDIRYKALDRRFKRFKS